MWEKILIALVLKVGELAWRLLTDAQKDRLAGQRIEAHIKNALALHRDLVLKYDELKDKGEMTVEKQAQYEKDAIDLEEDLVNNVRGRT